MMTRSVTLLAAASFALVSGCENLTPEQRTIVGITAGAAMGLITADALEADANWRLIAALAGAAAGTLVAQNMASNLCAYARGDGTYYTAACP